MNTYASDDSSCVMSSMERICRSAGCAVLTRDQRAHLARLRWQVARLCGAGQEDDAARILPVARNPVLSGPPGLE